MNKKALGHIFALISVLIWGTTFIATKVLLLSFSPVAILFYRFIIGYLMLWCLYPHKLKTSGWHEELLFFISGASGVTIYFLCENFALTYTYASNVSILVATAPLATGILAHFFSKEKLNFSFLIGFVLAIIGIIIVTTNGTAALHLNPLGDILAIGAALCWAVYSYVTVKVNKPEYSSIAVTRRIFFYGILTTAVILPLCGYNFKLEPFGDKKNILLLLFLGLIASGLCYIAWNKALDLLGAVHASVYIYLVPVVTVIFSYFILDEKLTLISLFGCVIILTGLFLSERK